MRSLTPISGNRNRSVVKSTVRNNNQNNTTQ